VRSYSPRHCKNQNSRLLVAWLPFFRLERCGWSPVEHVALVHPARGALRILALSKSAAREQIRTGMSATEARALLPTLQLEHLDSLEAEQHDLCELAGQLRVLGPHPSILAPDALCVEIGRTAHILGGENACVELALRKLRSLGHLSRITVVDGYSAGARQSAKALAEWNNKHQVILPNQLKTALHELPLKYLNISLPLLESLDALGIRTAGAVASLPASSIAHRYGQEGLRLQQLARATNQPSQKSIKTKTRLQPIFEHQFSAPAVHLAQLMPVLEQGLQQISKILVQQEQATLRLHLQLSLEDATEKHLHLHLGRAQRHPNELIPLLRQRLENLQLRAGAESCQIEAQELCPYTGQQRNLLDRSQTNEDFDALNARLTDSLGSAALISPSLENTHRPESEWAQNNNTHEKRTPEQHRPTLLLPSLRAVSVHVKNDCPDAIEIDGHWIDVRGTRGPERLCGEWWTTAFFDRDYWRLELIDGRQPWVFCDRTSNTWWLHGWFD
jgi:protein ImuB